MLYAMEPIDADLYTWYSFVFSVAGVAVSAVGLSVTFYQVRKARKSADAARDAAEATRAENYIGFRRYLALVVHRQLAEVEVFVARRQWELARLRCDDMAAVFAQLPEAEIAKQYRKFANFFRAKILQFREMFPQQTWDAIITSSKIRLDALISPFDAEASLVPIGHLRVIAKQLLVKTKAGRDNWIAHIGAGTDVIIVLDSYMIESNYDIYDTETPIICMKLSRLLHHDGIPVAGL